MEIYNGLGSKWKFHRDTVFQQRKEKNHYFKCNVMPDGPKGLLNAFIVSSISADLGTFPQ